MKKSEIKFYFPENLQTIPSRTKFFYGEFNHEFTSTPGADVKMKRIVIDNTTLVSGFNFNLVYGENDARDLENANDIVESDDEKSVQFYTTPEIQTEAENNYQSSRIITVALAQNQLNVQSASDQSLKAIEKSANKSGDRGALSNPDLSILGLAYELKNDYPKDRIILYSDDYSVQNTAAFLNIETKSLQKEGIQTKIVWQVYCPQCFRKHPAKKLGKECDFCGGILKRRRKRSPRKK
ncbi:MAG: PIN domain-containing protein [Promethearchaeota archaeon]